MALRHSASPSSKDTEHTLEARPGYLLKRVTSSAMADLAERLEHLGLRQVDVSVLTLIDANPGVIGSHIAQTLDIRGANMVPLLRRLEDADLLRREPIDGKSYALHLTSEGLAVLAKAHIVLDGFETDLLLQVPADLRKPFVAALQAIWTGQQLSSAPSMPRGPPKSGHTALRKKG
ncbi:MAG: winged helix DNA-binding protein [Sphingomonadales bacterium]|nr:winged helix DNA-binding protein [Sphingomonadales bacterium]NCO50412.1 winged helix DNA-binding protein [Sphingomonadales bacterium]NCP00759.1 winged helix DNA-binding protein [Sphingomonadales bacterium]NCP25489.1 winged helix DNA-binding protein [Sphingomonadales bacterium]NCP48774.1 winged helix DNA-binding protein [Sphingomonadales bacterium]